MKGIVMNLLAEFVEQQLGMAAWNELLSSTGYAGSYTSAETYPDEELLTLVQQVSQQTQIPVDDLIFQFGRFMFPEFVQRYPELVNPSSELIPFLLTIHDVIHVEVKKLYPDAQVPHFEYEQENPHHLKMFYHSGRKLCRLAEGLVDGAARHFDTTYSLEHEVCMHRGASRCELVVRTDTKIPVS